MKTLKKVEDRLGVTSDALVDRDAKLVRDAVFRDSDGRFAGALVLVDELPAPRKPKQQFWLPLPNIVTLQG